MKKLSTYLFLIFFSFQTLSLADQVLHCRTYLNITKYPILEDWKLLKKRDYTVTIKSKSIIIVGHYIGTEFEYKIISQNEFYLNAFFDNSDSDSAWIGFFSLNKKTNEMKMNGITSSGDDFSHGKCRKN